MTARFAIATALIAGCGGSCSGAPANGKLATRASAVSAPAVSAPREATPPPSALDPAARDPLQLMRIAESHRADELCATAETGRADHTTALLALAYAEDAELVLGRLGALAADRRRDDRKTVLTVIRDVAYRRPPAREVLDPDSLKGCIAALGSVAADQKDEPALRALASSALHGFARAGYVSEAAIAEATPAASAEAPTEAPRHPSR